MKLNPRQLLVPVAAALLTVTIGPKALHSQNKEEQSGSSRTKTRSKRKNLKSEESVAEANSSARATQTAESEGRSERGSKTERATAQRNQPSRPGNQTGSSRTAVNSERHRTSENRSRAQMPPSPGMVWVGAESEVYHKPGSRWYGKTKQGQWMTEAEAKRAGYQSSKE